MNHLGDYSFDWRAINVHVQGGKKDADQRVRMLNTATQTHQGDSSVRGSHNYSGLRWNRSLWIAKEVSHESCNQQKRNGGHPVTKSQRRQGQQERDYHIWNSIANHFQSCQCNGALALASSRN